MDFIVATRREGQINLSYSCEGFLGRYEGEVRNHIYRCDAGTMTASVLANGDISGCMSIRAHYAQGNIYRDRFSDVWQHRFEAMRDRRWLNRDRFSDVWQHRFEAMRDRRWLKRDACKDCKAWDWCVGGPFHLRGNDGEMLHCNYLSSLQTCD